jgi:hypothetical protein
VKSPTASHRDQHLPDRQARLGKAELDELWLGLRGESLDLFEMVTGKGKALVIVEPEFGRDAPGGSVLEMPERRAMGAPADPF